MKCLRSQDGIALVTALMFTLLCLAMIMALMYYLSANTKMSTAQKRYRNSLEASYGGTEFITKAVIPQLFTGYSSGKLALLTDFAAVNKLGLQIAPSGTDETTLRAKISSSTAAWPAGLARRSVNPKEMPDFVFTLKGQTTSTDYKVYGKIVDTVAGIGIVDASGIDYLDAAIGVAGNTTTAQTPRTPNIYTLEVQAEAAVNPTEKAGLSVLYAY